MKNLLILIAVFLIQSSLTAQNDKPAKGESVLEQYCRRAAKVPPVSYTHLRAHET